MGRFHCDRCGRGLLTDSDVRYEVRIDVRAGFDPPEITRRDLETDYREEIRRLIASMRKMSAEELEEQVHAERRFDLCATCRGEWLLDPLGARPSGT